VPPSNLVVVVVPWPRVCVSPPDGEIFDYFQYVAYYGGTFGWLPLSIDSPIVPESTALSFVYYKANDRNKQTTQTNILQRKGRGWKVATTVRKRYELGMMMDGCARAYPRNHYFQGLSRVVTNDRTISTQVTRK
jgi:hypothetical protein